MSFKQLLPFSVWVIDDYPSAIATIASTIATTIVEMLSNSSSSYYSNYLASGLPLPIYAYFRSFLYSNISYCSKTKQKEHCYEAISWL